jgi:hypothetical protein
MTLFQNSVAPEMNARERKEKALKNHEIHPIMYFKKAINGSYYRIENETTAVRLEMKLVRR